MSTLHQQLRIDDPLESAENFESRQAALNLRVVLSTLAVGSELAMQLGDEFLGIRAAQTSADCHRDILHLRARIESISRQVEDALSALDRIEVRQADLTAGNSRRRDAVKSR